MVALIPYQCFEIKQEQIEEEMVKKRNKSVAQATKINNRKHNFVIED